MRPDQHRKKQYFSTNISCFKIRQANQKINIGMLLDSCLDEFGKYFFYLQEHTLQVPYQFHQDLNPGSSGTRV